MICLIACFRCRPYPLVLNMLALGALRCLITLKRLNNMDFEEPAHPVINFFITLEYP